MRDLGRWLVWLAGIFGAIGLLLHLFVFDTWRVPAGADNAFGASIAPTLAVEDLVLVQRGRVPKYGELARCASPLVTGTFVVGRVFGEPGDRVEVSDSAVITNGKALSPRHGCPAVILAHPVTDALVTLQCGVAETGAWSFSFLSASAGHGLSAGASHALVEHGKLYLVSDNRLMHQDSRDFGQVDATTCEHVVYRLWGEKFGDASRRFSILW